MNRLGIDDPIRKIGIDLVSLIAGNLLTMLFLKKKSVYALKLRLPNLKLHDASLK